MVKAGRKTERPIPEWAARIVKARDDCGLNQKALGKLIGKSQQTIAGYETGSTEPSLAIYKSIAKETNVSPAWLIFGQEGRSESLSGVAVEADKNNRLFAWAFHQAARLFTEESVNADFSYTLAYTWKLLRSFGQESDEAKAKESVLRTIEIDRDEFRKDIDEARKKRL